MKKRYTFNIGTDCSTSFIVDDEIFTKEIAKEILDFWSWAIPYDIEEDLIEEALKKLAMEIMYVATINPNYGFYGIVNAFEDKEGWIKLNGTHGVVLEYAEGYEINENYLEMKAFELFEL